MQLKQRFNASNHIDIQFRALYNSKIKKTLDIDIKDSLKVIEESIIEPIMQIATPPPDEFEKVFADHRTIPTVMRAPSRKTN